MIWRLGRGQYVADSVKAKKHQILIMFRSPRLLGVGGVFCASTVLDTSISTLLSSEALETALVI